MPLDPKQFRELRRPLVADARDNCLGMPQRTLSAALFAMLTRNTIGFCNLQLYDSFSDRLG